MVAHLLMRLEAPLMSFGTTAVDHRRPIQPWPAVSMLTGLLANALGWDRSDTVALDRGWTTRGVVEERGGGADSYKSPHLRSRDYRADASVLVAVRLDEADEAPTLVQLASALDNPQRPLFLGRKGCLPATRICLGIADAVDAVQALEAVPGISDGCLPELTAIYFNEGAAQRSPDLRRHESSDERRFSMDVHAGRQHIYERTARGLP
jgi:CRISPR system Cascade subunit CasD